MAITKLTKTELEDMGACPEGMAQFFARVGHNAAESNYPGGWSQADSERVALVNPKHLRWLERRGLVPIHTVVGLPAPEVRAAERLSWQTLKGWKVKKLP